MDENFLKKVILNYFNKDSWDYNHALAAAYYMKKLIAKEGGDKKILLTAIYLHDIGYFPKGNLTLDDRMNKKKTHQIYGAKEAEKILKNRDYSDEEIKQIMHLIEIHDELAELKTKEEFMIFEADTLGQIDYTKVKSSFSPEDFKRYYDDHLMKERVPRFYTETGKKYLNKLLKRIKIDIK